MKKTLISLVLFLSLIFSFLLARNVNAVSDPGNPLLEYKQNIGSTDTNLDQFVGGTLPQTTEGKRANGVVDSLILKSISITAGLPDENGNPVGGIIGISGVAIAALFDNPPASGVTYFADLFHNAGFVKPAYAQGVGFSGLSPILILWKATRNFAYILITVLFILLGLMIMFRVKLSPQSVVSVQNAIPKIVMTLILITFSYAIAGLMIDLGNLILVIIIKVFASTGLINAELTSSEWLNAGIGTVFQLSVSNLFSGLFGIFTSPGAGYISAPGAIGGGITALIPIIIAGASSGGTLLAIMASLTILAGLCLAIVGILLKIFIMMIKAYVSIILGVVFGPIQIVFDALPGQKTSAVKSWAKSLMGNILVFPVVAILFILCAVFDELLTGGGVNKTIWTPPAFSGDSMLVVSAIKIGVLMIIPNIDKMIMQALDIKTSLSSSLTREDTLLQGVTKGYEQNYAKEVRQMASDTLKKGKDRLGQAIGTREAGNN